VAFARVIASSSDDVITIGATGPKISCFNIGLSLLTVSTVAG
jgi:hypothetical protein